MGHALNALKRYGVTIFVVSACVAYGVYSTKQENKRRDDKAHQEAKWRDIQLNSIREFASTTKADFQWPFALSNGEDIHLQRLITSDLQSAWHERKGRIVFVGRLLDTYDLEDGDTAVLLEHVGLPHFRENLRMHAFCGKIASNAIRTAVAESKKTPLSPHLAITVDVRAVEKLPAITHEESTTYLGKGFCITATPLIDWPPTGYGSPRK